MKTQRNVLHWFASDVCFSYGKDIFSGQLGGACLLTEVPNVIQLRKPAKVRETVVLPVAIDVIGIMPFGSWADEGLKHQAVDGDILELAVAVEKDHRIPNVAYSAFKDVGNGYVAAALSHSAHATEVGYFVPPLVINDGSPFFGKFGERKLFLHWKPTLSGVTEPGADTSRLHSILPEGAFL